MKVIKRIIILIVLIFVAVSCFIVGQGYQMYQQAIEKEPILDKIKALKKEDSYRTIEQLPKDYLNAVISIEDHRFYQHKGVDIRSIGRALVTDLKEQSLEEGGSTITQQVAKNVYFTQSKRFSRKIAEILMAIELEKNCSKEEILEIYVNTRDRKSVV